MRLLGPLTRVLLLLLRCSCEEDDARLGPRHRTTLENFGIQRDREPASDVSKEEKQQGSSCMHPASPWPPPPEASIAWGRKHRIRKILR